MKILCDVLKACGYREEATFSFAWKHADQEKSQQVRSFVAEQYPDDVYLLTEILPGELVCMCNNRFLPALASAFRKQAFHNSSMDRNTTLLLSCLCAEEERIDHAAKVQIEDDPYYFKKYVFAYSKEEQTAALEYIAQQQEEKLPEIIRGCLLDTKRFASYKKDAAGQQVYAFFAELAAKVTVLLIRPDHDHAIITVQSLWQEQLRNAPEINLDALERVLELDAEPEEMLARWCSLTGSDGDGGEIS